MPLSVRPPWLTIKRARGAGGGRGRDCCAVSVKVPVPILVKARSAAVVELNKPENVVLLLSAPTVKTVAVPPLMTMTGTGQRADSEV